MSSESWDLGLVDKLASAAFGGLSRLAPATSTILGTTATRTRQQMRGTQRAVVKPPAHKPTVVATPQPQAPRVEPSTLSPNMAPVAKLGAVAALSKRRDRVSAGTPPTGGRPQKPGEDMRTRKPGPSNEPVTHVNGGPRDF